MDDNPTPIATLFERAKEYGKTNLKLFQYKLVDKSADLLSTLLCGLLILLLAASAFLILNLGLALWIGSLLGASFYGFFVVGGFYILTAVILFVFRAKWVKNPINNALIQQMLNKK